MEFHHTLVGEGGLPTDVSMLVRLGYVQMKLGANVGSSKCWRSAVC